MSDVIRVQRSGGYTVLPNGILRDAGLSLKTKGLFAIILSLPEDWDYSVAGLATVAGCGRDAIRTALGEMERAGYLTRARSHGEGGKFTGMMYTVRDVAAPLSENPTMAEEEPLSGKPMTDNPTSEKPLSENPTQLNKELQSKDLINPYSPLQGDEADSAELQDKLFARFWAAYPPRQGKRAGKQAARRAWDKLRPNLELCRRMAEALVRDKQSPQWREADGKFIPMASTWLNGKAWEDEYIAPSNQPPDRPPPAMAAREEVPTW